MGDYEIISKRKDRNYFTRYYTLDDIYGLLPLDNGRHDAVPPTYTLGSLEKFPRELLDMVIELLDIRSLTDLRRVNRRAMQLVNSIPTYRSIMEHAYGRTALRGILSIGAGKWISCRTLYEKLFTAECDICGKFGGFLYLITCRRVCWSCFNTDTEYLPLRQSEVIRKFGLRRGQIAKLPSMRTIQGCYTGSRIEVYGRLKLIDYRAARQLGFSVHGTEKKMEQNASDMLSKRLERYNARRTAGKLKTRKPRTKDQSYRETRPRRYAAVVLAPFCAQGFSSMKEIYERNVQRRNRGLGAYMINRKL